MSTIVHTSTPLSSFICTAKNNLSSPPSQYNTCTTTKRCLLVRAIDKFKAKAEAKPRSQEDDYHATLKALNSKGRTPRKSLGQHYMLNSSINEQLVAAANVKKGDVVLEIGPGTGSLASVLVDSGATVLAVEKWINSLCFVNDLCIEDMEKLYQQGEYEAMTVAENADNKTTENRKRKERDEESSSEAPTDGTEDDSQVQRKKRVIWTSEMHRKFVDAIAQIGEDRAFPKKIVEVMNEPGLTRENVASHLQKYRLCLKKSQEERDRYFQGNYQHHYLGTSQFRSKNHLPMSTSSHSSLYGINTGIGASRVRLAPPSYSSFEVSSLPINTGNVHNQCSRMEANKSCGGYGGEERSILLGNLNKRPCSKTWDYHATSSSTSSSAFLGLRIADDGKSLLFGGSNKSEIISTRRNDFHYQESAAPIFPSFNIENYAQDSPLPPLPDFEDHLEEPLLPPLPEFYVENSLPQFEAEENEFMNFTPQQDTHFGTSLTEDINSFSSRHTCTSLDQEILLPCSPSEIPWNLDSDPVPQIYKGNVFDEQSIVPPSVSDDRTPNANVQSLSSFYVNMW